jgi:hypothetical protein
MVSPCFMARRLYHGVVVLGRGHTFPQWEDTPSLPPG